MANISKHIKVIEGCTPGSIPVEIGSSAEPLVLKGLVKDWDITKAAVSSPETAVNYLKSYYNGNLSLINKGHSGIEGRYFYNQELNGLNYDTVKMRIDEALDLILASTRLPEKPSYYISSNTIDTHFPGLRATNDIQLPRADRGYPVYPPDVKIWIGTRSIATCHYDALENIACVVAGKRRFTLFPPSQFENLYFGPLSPTPGGQAISMVDFRDPDYEQFPRFKIAEANGLMAELEAGDAIFMPSMWMHHVEGLSDFNILVNYWWDDAPVYTGSGMTVLQHALLGLRDKPAHEKMAWKHLFDYYIFGDAERAAEHLPEHARGVLGPLDEIKARQLRSIIINKLNR
ncbi:cupin-like domain-containing protein [Cellvibrio sp. OA-2007]|uniref:cupin-like domain-containing protein n=1 Tax=Cellvibrio sp. OA-2007 TaxID=529823 RepID=UPI000786751D|nr:cupin-like domain-containing protein [Cellvibrio sp. OA-2007]